MTLPPRVVLNGQFKVGHISNFTNGLTLNWYIFKGNSMGSLDASVQGASFYVERID